MGKDTPSATTVSGRKERPLVFNPSAGTHITNACKEAAALAISKRRNVRFTFNEVTLLATPDKSWKALATEWSDENERRAEAYRNSPRGKAAAAKRGRDVITKQKSVDALILNLPKALKSGLDATVRWIKAFTDPSDDIGVRCDKAGLVLSFRAFGYCTNEHVGEKPELFNTRERIGRYLIGQVMDCLEHGLSPHPRTLYFCDKYFATLETGESPSVPVLTEKHLAHPVSKTDQLFIERGRRIYYSVSQLVKIRENGFSFRAKLSFPRIHEDHFTRDTLNRWGRDLVVWNIELSEADYSRFLILTAGYICPVEVEKV